VAAAPVRFPRHSAVCGTPLSVGRAAECRGAGAGFGVAYGGQLAVLTAANERNHPVYIGIGTIVVIVIIVLIVLALRR
jgi:2-keto-3-deoxy-6-phosphogluconate aldolase